MYEIVIVLMSLFGFACLLIPKMNIEIEYTHTFSLTLFKQLLVDDRHSEIYYLNERFTVNFLKI